MTLLLAIIGHLVGDYLLQNDWMAQNKKRVSAICFVHCFIWTVSVCAISPSFASGLTPFILLATHFAQDRTQIVVFWMTKVNRQPKFVQPPMAPWSIIVVDNVWHIVTLWAVWRWIV